MLDTLPVRITPDQLQPGDLIFTTGAVLDLLTATVLSWRVMVASHRYILFKQAPAAEARLCAH
jgi:hypothetical protein